ncbi:unnamed protein product [Rotaria sordida]|uniref:HTH CENPB-type domain-containing protein n=1 Tax=Rotaria sordida TaxID=392033 RepID=A0A819MQS5_9BILA|nr:unnamed protein product [Rotaria sordida]CAF1205310.1 unnamed protein product [Rotaria sordida]CAF3969426.1 unnamed protein product [Rotaria sordida]CAF3985349.1 unnamed protein product [Rotaria sordida]CAF4078648.1 unnamed protein product [Rotaria sordida]
MTTRHELCLEEKINLIREKEQGLSHRELSEKFEISLGAVSNILKRKCEYTNDYETNCNKKLKRKLKDDLRQEINDNVYEWFVAQRAKNIPISGPILQEYAREIGKKLDHSNEFKASNGWLDRFRTRYNINFRIISGESRSIDEDTIIDWKSRLSNIIEDYDPHDVFNCDETALFYKLMPDKSLVVDKNDCKGGKKSKERYTVMLCTNWTGSEKLKPVVIGKANRPRCFKNIDIKKLPVLWCSNRNSWMTCKIFTEWLIDLDSIMRKQKRHILLFLDNAPVHPHDVQLENIKLKFFPANTTAKIQPMDQGVIRAFKAYYRRSLVKHIIASAGVAAKADDINVTALDAVYWIQNTWDAVTETTIRNTLYSN